MNVFAVVGADKFGNDWLGIPKIKQNKQIKWWKFSRRFTGSSYNFNNMFYTYKKLEFSPPSSHTFYTDSASTPLNTLQ